MTRPLLIKVCGMRDADNIRHVEALAPDWMGFICWEGSSRHVAEVPDYLPVTCRRVGVFVNPSKEYVGTHVHKLGLDLVQLHGHESPDFCHAIKTMASPQGRHLEVIKAFGIAAGQPFPDTKPYEAACDYFLFDTRTPLAGAADRRSIGSCSTVTKAGFPSCSAEALAPTACLPSSYSPIPAGLALT